MAFELAKRSLNNAVCIVLNKAIKIEDFGFQERGMLADNILAEIDRAFNDVENEVKDLIKQEVKDELDRLEVDYYE